MIYGRLGLGRNQQTQGALFTMFVTLMSTNEHLNGRHWSHSTVAPDWKEIESAIERLDGNFSTMVTLGTDEDYHMAILGGEGRYAVYATFDWSRFHTLIEPGREGEQAMTLAGQRRPFPSRAVVDRDSVLRAARAFAFAGQLEDSLHWEQG